jgi:hypothetical protein
MRARMVAERARVFQGLGGQRIRAQSIDCEENMPHAHSFDVAVPQLGAPPGSEAGLPLEASRAGGESEAIAATLADPGTLECLLHLKARGAFARSGRRFAYLLIRAAIALSARELRGGGRP